MSKNLVIELKKPYLFEDEEYAAIDLSGMENLTMQDAIEAQKNVVGTGEDSVILYAPEASQAFIDEIAAMAAKQPVEFFNGMPIGLSDKVRTAVQGVFSADDNKAKDRVVTLDKPYTYDGKAVSVIDLSGVEELTSKDVSAAENEVLKFHMQEAFQRIQMDTRPDGFATVIMDELNQDKVKQLQDACHRMMVEGDFVKYENVYHGVLTECSSQSAGIQLADYAVGIMNSYLRKHLMSRGDYTFATDLYTEFVLPHMRKHANGTIVGYGVREVPSDFSIRQILMSLFN